MKNPIKTFLSVLFFGFAVSFVAGIIGVIIFAFWLGYSNKITRHCVNSKEGWYLVMLIITMELSFLASGWLHADVIYNFSHFAIIAIGLSSGLLFFFLGAHRKRYIIAKNYYPFRNKRFKWYSFKIPVMK